MNFHTNNEFVKYTSRAAFFFIGHYFIARASEFYWVAARMGDGIESVPLLIQAIRFPLSPFLVSFDYWLKLTPHRNSLVLINSALFALGATLVLYYVVRLLNENKER